MHHRPPPYRPRAIGWPAALLLVLLLAVPPAAAQGPDEVVPEGVLLFGLDYSRETQTRSIGRNDNRGRLLLFLEPDKARRHDLDGDISRTVTETTLRLTYGLADDWNLALRVPHVEVAQESSLEPVVDTPAAEASADRLAEERVTGAGDVRLASLHRPVFSDRNGFIWGYGVEAPGGQPQNDWVGLPTLTTRGPAPRIFGLLHYSRYPAFSRSRFDLRAEVGAHRRARVETPEGKLESTQPGLRVALETGWQQQIGPVHSGLALGLLKQNAGSGDADTVGDHSEERFGRAELGFGNLSALEQGPVSFPYLVLLRYRHTLDGFNTPLHRRYTLAVQTYF